MNQYLIPANSKKGQLIFNLFRTIDLVVLLIGGVLTLAFMIVLPGDQLWVLVIKLLPICVCALLVMPLANYHNVMVFVREMIAFYYREMNMQNRYRWKGWCAANVYGGERKK